MEIEETKRKLQQKNSKVEVQENVQEITEHNENKQGQAEERGVKEILVEQGEMPNWKTPGPDGVQRYWIKNVSNLHNSIALQLDRCLQENNLPKWMVTRKTLLCIKEIQKGNLVSHFRPISCLPLIWKLLTSILAEELYEHLEKANSLPWEQKGCRKGSPGTKDQLLIDKMIVKDCKKRLRSLQLHGLSIVKPKIWSHIVTEVHGDVWSSS